MTYVKDSNMWALRLRKCKTFLWGWSESEVSDLCVALAFKCSEYREDSLASKKDGIFPLHSRL